MSTRKVGAASTAVHVVEEPGCCEFEFECCATAIALGAAALPQPDVDRSAAPPVNTLHRSALASDAVEELIETNGRAQSEPIHPALTRAGGGTTDRKKTKRIALLPRHRINGKEGGGVAMVVCL